ncbi:hypothetical protein ES703_100115 [subsurface metagenome]
MLASQHQLATPLLVLTCRSLRFGSGRMLWGGRVLGHQRSELTYMKETLLLLLLWLLLMLPVAQGSYSLALGMPIYLVMLMVARLSATSMVRLWVEHQAIVLL